MQHPDRFLVCRLFVLISVLVLAAAPLAARQTSLYDLGLPGELLGVEAGKAGWQEEAPGLLRLDSLDGRRVYLARGAAGLSVALDRLRARGEELVDRFLADPQAAELLAVHARVLASLESRLEQAGSGRATAAAGSCSGFTIDLQTDAGFQGCNNTAYGRAGYQTSDILDCPSCELYAYAYTRRSCGSFLWSSNDTCYHAGTSNNVCEAFTQRSEPFDYCSSYAYAYVSCDEPIGFLWVEDDDTACGGFGCNPAC